MATTPNLRLYVTPSEDTNITLMDWVRKIASSDADSNMMKLDRAYKELLEYRNSLPSVQIEVDKSLAISGMAADAAVTGSRLQTLADQIAKITSSGGSVTVDTTLTVAGAAADAETVGVKISDLSRVIDEINTAIEGVLIGTAVSVDLEPIATRVGGDA